MAVKTITIKREVYEKLVSLKGANESFSTLLERLLSGNSSLDVLSKLKGSVDWKNKRKLVKEIYSKRFEKR